jgi:hypothetical protein
LAALNWRDEENMLSGIIGFGLRRSTSRNATSGRVDDEVANSTFRHSGGRRDRVGAAV